MNATDIGVAYGWGVGVVGHEIDGGLGGDTAFSERAGREFVWRGTYPVARGEQSLDRSHTVVTPEILAACDVFGAADPCARLAGMGTHDVGLGQNDLAWRIFGRYVLGCPGQCLGNCHIQEIFPCFIADLVHLSRVSIRYLLHRHIGPHIHGAEAVFDVQEHLMVPERSGCWDSRAVGLILLQFVRAGYGIIFAIGIKHLGVEILEPHTHGPVSSFESGGHESMFHLSHFGPDGNHETVCSAGGEHRVPRAAKPLTHGTRAENV